MQIIKTFMTAAGLVALAACQAAEENNMATDPNMMMTDNFGMDANMTTDMNMTDMNATDMNATDMNAVNTTDTTTNNTY